MDVIILAGGKGTRMDSDLPKPLIKAKNKPIISHQIDYLLKSKEIDRIILSIGHESDKIINFIKTRYSSFPIEFSVETEPLGTGGAIKKALGLSTSEKVIVLNCDDITDIKIEELAKNKESTICIAHPRLPFGRVLDNNGYAKFEEKPILKDQWVSCGWYLLKKSEILSHLPDKGSIEYDVFPKIKIKLHKHEGFWQTLNSKKDLQQFEETELPDFLRD